MQSRIGSWFAHQGHPRLNQRTTTSATAASNSPKPFNKITGVKCVECCVTFCLWKTPSMLMMQIVLPLVLGLCRLFHVHMIWWNWWIILLENWKSAVNVETFKESDLSEKCTLPSGFHHVMKSVSSSLRISWEGSAAMSQSVLLPGLPKWVWQLKDHRPKTTLTC